MDTLIFSNKKFLKDDQRYIAALDYSSGRLKVFRDVSKGNDLTSHFTKSNSSAEMIQQNVFDAIESGIADKKFLTKSTRTFVYMPTSRCNMGCDYCGQTHDNKNSPQAVDEAFLRRVLFAFADDTIEHVHVAWFGGEPMLAYRAILNMSNKIIAAAEKSQKRYSSKMTTNGSLLTTKRLQELIEVCKVSRFDITIDGPEQVHNRHRPLKSGGKSYANIIRTLDWYSQASFESRALIVLRTNVDRNNFAHIFSYLNEMKDRGFVDPRKFLYELAPVHSWGNDLSSTALSTEEAAVAEIQWMEEMERLGLPYGLLPGEAVISTCVATDRRSEVIGPDGTLFSCTETPLTEQAPKDAIGSVTDLQLSISRPAGQYDRWASALQDERLPCSTCELRPVCGGACPKLWSEGVVACPTTKLNFDERVQILMRRNGYVSV